MSKTKKPEKINLHKSFKGEERRIYNSFRSSFATHLLENGIDLRYMQQLLGHKHSRAREIYAFVSRKFSGKIKSPLDTIKGGEYCIQ